MCTLLAIFIECHFSCYGRSGVQCAWSCLKVGWTVGRVISVPLHCAHLMNMLWVGVMLESKLLSYELTRARNFQYFWSVKNYTIHEIADYRISTRWLNASPFYVTKSMLHWVSMSAATRVFDKKGMACLRVCRLAQISHRILWMCSLIPLPHSLLYGNENWNATT